MGSFRLMMFSLGQFGWSLASYAVGSLLVYFYLPPDNGAQPLFPPYIFQGAVLGVLTVIGCLSAAGRTLDAFTNPLIASWSDRSQSRWGRRRFYMMLSVLPFAVFSVLVFQPLVTPIVPPGSAAESWVNIVWLAFTLFAFYFFFVMYTAPYTALIAELGKTSEERLKISTWISVTWAMGFMVGNLVYALQGWLEAANGWTGAEAFRFLMVVYGVVAFVFMLLPIIFVDERKYARFQASKEEVWGALRSTFRNKNFFRFISAELFYFICLNIIQMGLVFFVTTLLGLDKGLVSLLTTVMYLESFLFYYPINLAARRFRKKKVLLFAYGVLAVVFGLCAFMGILPLPPVAHAWLVALLAALPLAIFGILPNAIVADISEADGLETGNFKAGIFFGVRTFEMNLGIALANILLPSLLNLGRTAVNPAGIRLAAILAGALCLVGLLLFLGYDEKAIHRRLEAPREAT
jgi:Na+/melibiose symporter-like transporter